MYGFSYGTPDTHASNEYCEVGEWVTANVTARTLPSLPTGHSVMSESRLGYDSEKPTSVATSGNLSSSTSPASEVSMMHVSTCLREPAAAPVNPPISGEMSSQGCSSSVSARVREKAFSARSKNDWNASCTGVGEQALMRVAVSAW